MVKSEKAIRRALADLERRLAIQLGEILDSEKGFGGPESCFFDMRLTQRHSLRFVLGLRHKPFHAVCDWEGWR